MASPAPSPLKKSWHLAVQEKNLPAMKTLREQGADLEWRSAGPSCLMTALHQACMDDWEDGAGWLIAQGANVNASMGTKESALSLALMGGNRVIVSELLRRPEILLNQISLEGLAPLHRAVSHDASDLVRCLLDAGADPFLKSDSGMDALEIAEEEGAEESLEVLRPFLASRQAASLAKVTKSAARKRKSSRL